MFNYFAKIHSFFFLEMNRFNYTNICIAFAEFSYLIFTRFRDTNFKQCFNLKLCNLIQIFQIIFFNYKGVCAELFNTRRVSEDL